MVEIQKVMDAQIACCL